MRRIVIGVGNPSRGDDGAGLEVARRVRTVPTSEQITGSYGLIDLWQGYEDVVIVDAARSGAPAGSVHRFDVEDRPLPQGLLATSSHSIGVAETIEMARKLGRLPRRLLVYGIEASDVALGSGLSPEVAGAVREVVEEIDHA
ncbi:MAG TPA: hydrogenase maturation protease [Acidimicrobiia bacterium]